MKSCFSHMTSFVLVGLILIASAGQAGAVETSSEVTQGNLDPKLAWPSPVDDMETYSLTLLELLEYKASRDGSLNWDLVAWRGGDIHRLWVKTEGAHSFSASNGEADLQLLYGKLVTSFFDAQIGARLEQSWGDRKASRLTGVLGVQGISLYLFELEAAVFFADAGQLASRITASKDFLFSQRAILQARLESDASLKRSEAFETGSGINNLELGLRLRYEIKREIAPYVGVNWRNLFGETADFRIRSGQETSEWNFVTGLRAWY
ncbi:MAG: copper resistance protein B [Bdellovibrionales bacterium]